MSAIISGCGKFRYKLTREFEGGSKPPVLFLMLNPSTADATVNDRTINRCISFAKRWGHSGLVVANLYAFRTPKPSALKAAGYPVGEENDQYLRELLAEHKFAVCGWGNNAQTSRAKEVLNIANEVGAQLMCLKKTQAKQPSHPLYLKGSTGLKPWSI